MTNEQLEQLLYEEEGATLDFKRDQYAFQKASDEEKSELLKDIVGFANAWRRSDALILIGVKEVRGSRSIVHGVSEHLDDHSLQQFVNNVLNRPLQFCYEAREIDGKSVGVIRINSQRRPFYLKRDYGKLQKDKVYVRRGSSTSIDKPADLDEVASMGNDAAADLGTQASFDISLADPDKDQRMESPLEVTSEYVRPPKEDDIAAYVDKPHTIKGIGRTFEIPAISPLDNLPNEDYYLEVARHHWFQRLFMSVRAEVKNTSTITANDVIAEIKSGDASGFYLADYSCVPESPKRRRSFIEQRMPKIPRGGFLRNTPGHIEFERKGEESKLEIHCGVIQPGRSIWSDPFYLAVRDYEPFKILGKIYSSSLSEPQSFEFDIRPSISESTLSLDELYKLAEQFVEE